MPAPDGDTTSSSAREDWGGGGAGGDAWRKPSVSELPGSTPREHWAAVLSAPARTAVDRHRPHADGTELGQGPVSAPG